MRYNLRNMTKFPVYCIILVLTSVPLILTKRYSKKTAGNNVRNAVIKIKWFTSGDMVTKVPIERRLKDVDEGTAMNEEYFFFGDVNDRKQARETSGQDSFWELYKKLDSGKKPPVYNQLVRGSKPVLTKFRYVVVPVWYEDDDTSVKDKKI